MKTLFKESIVSVKRNFKRFLSILLIVLLGVGFFAGIRVTSPNMKKTIDKCYEDNNFMDLNIMSSWGLKDSDIDKLKGKGYDIEPSYEFDAIVKGETEEVIKIISYDENSKINDLILLEGKLPTKDNECVIEQNQYTKSHKIGDKILVEDDTLKEQNLTIVGIIKSPIYTSLERGTTKLLSGKINFYMYVPISNFDIDYYTSAAVSLNTDLSTFSDEYEDLIEEKTKYFEELTSQIGEERYTTEIEKANDEIEKQTKKLEEEKEKYNKEIQDAELKIKNAKSLYRTNLDKLNKKSKDVYSEFDNAYAKLDKARKELDSKKEEFKVAQEQFNSNNELLQANLKQLEEKQSLLISTIDTINTNLNSLNNQKEDIEILINNGIEIEKNTLILNEINQKINDLTTKKEEAESNLLLVNNSIDEINNTIDNYRNELENASITIKNAEEEIEANQKELDITKDKANKEIENARKELRKAYSEIINSQKILDEKKKEAEGKFEDAEIQIKNAKQKVSELEKPTWYILDRNSNLGFYQYSQDTERIKNVGKIFPMVFFLVAILICLTSMTRMVEEERSQLGTLKAIGYSNFQIISKYVIYALLATIIGSVIGVYIGFRILPSIIFSMYSMMYNIGDIVYDFNIGYALSGTLIAIFCTVVATLFACYKELKESPASLMRPKSPKAGKRVLLERIGFIWKRLSFTRKVTVRNVFRYKKRFLMTVIGISGCTGLIIAGFGLRDCITGMVPAQYGKVFDYQLEVTFKDDVTLEEKNSEVERIKKSSMINDVLLLNKESVTIENKNTTQSIQLIVPFENPEGIINLANRTTGVKYTLNDKVIVTEKIAKLLDLEVGDKITLKTDKTYDVEIGAITENYFYHYIYMSKDTYDSNYYNTLFIKTDELTEEEEKSLSTYIKEKDAIANISFTSSMSGVFDKTMKNFGYVAVVLIVSAGLLAFVVLYNLANVNISERKRELATIKVLGFNDREVYKYIGRETTILTVIGMIFGVLIGKLLTIFILKTCELDPIMFDNTIKLTSYVYSLLLTTLFTIIVNITTYFSLKKVDMIESLKSVE